MINTEQEKQILRYLKSKGLAEDMQLEIFDHIIIQIENHIENGDSFEQAFEKIKISWKRDLENVWLNWYRVPIIQAKKVKSIGRNIFIKSFTISIVLVCLLFSLIGIFSKENIILIYRYYIYAIIGITICLLVSNIKYTFSILQRKIAIGDLYSSPIISIFVVIASSVIRNIQEIDSIFDIIIQNRFLELSILIIVIYIYTALALYLSFLSIKYYKDSKQFKINKENTFPTN